MTDAEAIDYANKNDATVSRMREANCTDAQIILRLVQEKESLFLEIGKFIAIAPFKVKTHDGKMLVWRCPEHLIPER